MRREYGVTIVADSNHLTVSIVGQERVGSTWIAVPALPEVDLICDPEEDGRGLLKDALVALIERL